MKGTGESGGTAVARGAPGASGAGPWWWPRRRSAVFDILLALVSMAECASEGRDFARDAGIPTASGVALGLVVGSVLLLRRRWPVAVVLVSVAVTPAEMGFLLGIAGLYSLATSDIPRSTTATLAGMSIVGTLVVTYLKLRSEIASDPDFDPPLLFVPGVSLAMGLVLTAPPVLLGLYVRARRRLVESLRDRADGLERELSLLADRAEERAEWARNEERARIAREMHDVVAHRVSLMVVHAAALRAVVSRDPEAASRNAELVGDMGRQALTELREMLGVLRSSPADREAAGAERLAAMVSGAETSTRGAAGGSRPAADADPRPGADQSGSSAPGSRGPAPRGVTPAGQVPAPRRSPRDQPAAPSRPGAGWQSRAVDGDADGPHLSGLEDLVEQSRAAGMTVELSVDGKSDAYGRGVEQTAFRVVQEALTNVHKHAPGARTRVRVAHREGELAIQVENGPSNGAASDAGLPSGGNGLLGMRERVASLGGVFVSGVTEAGGFRVSAVLPAVGMTA
ncbi:histidine kinase [Streptomyces sp. NPDC059740]|uniref:sensor histidine kinase n=1 Tax=Streptomyces sp. NPDC059740 TaxID=3346926 RepID=UPI00364ACED9